MNKLMEIYNTTVERMNKKQKEVSINELISATKNLDTFRGQKFESTLKQNDISFICEVKKASPSKGVIAEDFDYVKIAKEYEEAGAAAISVLTEPFYFLGHDKYLQEISQNVKTPLLRKDFFVNEYMIYEAKLLGASAILLIVAMLEEERLKDLIKLANELGLATLVETHDEKEVETALNIGAKIIGVNNRNLKTFETDIKTSERLRKLVPNDKIFVSESGIKTPEDIEFLRKIGANATLIGETFMRSENKIDALKKLRGEK